MQPAGHFIELGEAGADPLDALARIEKSVDAPLVVVDDLRRREQARADLRFPELQQRLFRAGENLSGILFRQQTAVHHLLRGGDDAPKHGFVPDDLDVAVEIRNLRQSIVK